MRPPNYHVERGHLPPSLERSLLRSWQALRSRLSADRFRQSQPSAESVRGLSSTLSGIQLPQCHISWLELRARRGDCVCKSKA